MSKPMDHSEDDRSPAAPRAETVASESDAAQRRLGEFGYRQQLQRSLRLRDLVVYGLVFIVPIAPFAVFGVVLDGCRGTVSLTCLVGLLAMLFTAVSYQQLSRAFPLAGSVYSYVGRGVAEWLGFLAGWAILLDYVLIPTLLSVLGAVAVTSVLPALPQWVVIVVFVAVTTTVNLAGIETTAIVNGVFLVLELLVLAAFVTAAVVAVGRGVGGAVWSIRPLFDPAQFSVPLVFAALSVAVLSFLGFDAISTLAEETNGGSRVVGRAIVMALGLGAVLFVGQTWLAALLLPGVTSLPDQAAQNTAFYDVAAIAGGPVLKLVVSLTGAAAALANVLVAQAAVSRLLFAMARDGALPALLGRVSQRGVPVSGVLLVSGLSLALGVGLAGRVELLSSLVNVGALSAFLTIHVAVVWYFLVRCRTRRWLTHLAVPATGFLIIGYVLVNADVDAQILGAAWLAVGAVVLVIRTRASTR